MWKDSLQVISAAASIYNRPCFPKEDSLFREEDFTGIVPNLPFFFTPIYFAHTCLFWSIAKV